MTDQQFPCNFPSDKSQQTEGDKFDPENLKIRDGDCLSRKSPQRDDNWTHRSSGMRCATCMWFVQKCVLSQAGTKMLGRCRRHCPTMLGYPVVFHEDWCGDHKLDENKVV